MNRATFANGQSTTAQDGDVLTHFYKDGTVRARGVSIDGRMEGEWTFYRATGQLWQVGSFRRNLKHGRWVRYDRKDRVEYEEAFADGEAVKRPARRLQRQGGFTLLEILVAVSIMTILLGLIMYGMGGVRRKGYDEGSRAAVLKIKTALDAYRATYGNYPPDGFDAPVKTGTGGSAKIIKGGQCLVHFLAKPTIQEIEIGSDIQKREREPFLDATTEMLSGEGDVEERLNLANAEFVDAYGNGIHYDNTEEDATGKVRFAEQSDSHLDREAGQTVNAPDPRRPRTGSGGSGGGTGFKSRNPGAYDLWSHGQKMADPGDDITSWD